MEDDPDIIQITRMLLEDQGEYHYATTLVEARQRLHGERFDILLLDMELPDGSGADLLQMSGLTCPVVIFSAQQPGQALSQQVAAALTKSATSNQQLLDTIKETYQRSINHGGH